MNERLINGRIGVFAAIIFVLFGTIIWMYIGFVKPVQEERQDALTQLEFEQAQLAGIQQQISTQPVEIIESSVLIQRKIPVRPLVDQMLLTFARAEGLSDVYILSIDIDDGATGWFSIEGELPDDEPEVEDSTVVELNDLDGNEDEGVEIEVTSAPVAPNHPSIEELEAITFSLLVRANEYDGFAQFMRELDRNDRILSIDSVSYIAPKERVYVEDDIESLEFIIRVSAFYYPNDDQQLEEELPQIKYPKPANKKDPLYNQ